MSVLQSVSLSDAALKIRWLEQYVSAGINQKSVAANAKGVIAGFRVVPNAGMVVTVQMDPQLNLSVANVLETSGGPFSLTVVQNSNVNIDLTGQQNSTVYIALDVQYAINVPTVGNLRVVDAAELIANPDLVVLAKVNVPANPGPVLATHINMGYRLSAGDLTPPESYQALNLIGNSSFENNSVLGWTTSGSVTAAASTDRAHTGSYSMKLVSSAGSPFVNTIFLFVVPGRSYKVGAWLCAPVALTGSGAKLQVSWFNSAGTIIGSAVDVEAAFTGGTVNFAQVLAELTAPALAYYAQVRVFFNASTGTLYVDDVKFVDYHVDSVTEQIWGFGGTEGAAEIGTLALATWADGTTNPASNVQAQFAKIVTDLKGQSGTGGAGKIGFTPTGNIASNRVDTALAELDTEKAGLGLTNVFTALNTFNNGISVGNGVAVTTSNLTFTSGAQAVVWPNWKAYQASSTQFNFDQNIAFITDTPVFFDCEPTIQALIKTDDNGGTQAVFGSDSNMAGGAVVGSLNNVPLYFLVNNTNYWTMLGQQIQATSPGQISGLADPTLAQDATTLHAQTLADNLLPPRNYVLNSSMEFWQRCGLVPADSALPVAPSYTFRADRWYSFIASGSGANTFNSCFFFLGAIPFNQIKRTSGVDTNLAKRSLVYEVEYDQVPYLANVNGSTGLPLTLQFGMLNGAGITGTLVAKIYQGNSGVFASGYAAQSVCFTSSSLIAGGTFQLKIPGGSIPGSAARLAIVFEWTPSANPAVANESFSVKDVMLVAGDRTPGGAILAPNRSCATIELEYAALARYYEKSYFYNDVPGTSTVVGQYTTVCGAIAVPQNQTFKMTHPRYKFPKNGPGVVTLWSPTGTPGQWTAASTPGTPVSTTNTSAVGFEVTNPSVGTITPATNAVEMTGHWAVSCEVGEF